MSRLFLFAGVIFVLMGAVILLAGRLGLSPGRLPGDIRIERHGAEFYFPLASCLLLSIALTIVLNILLRILRK